MIGDFRMGKIFEMRSCCGGNPKSVSTYLSAFGNFESVRVTALVRRGGSVRWRIAENNSSCSSLATRWSAFSRTENCWRNRRRMKRSGSLVSIHFEFEPFLERFRTGTSLSSRVVFPRGAFLKLDADRPSRAATASFSNAANWHNDSIPQRRRIPRTRPISTWRSFAFDFATAFMTSTHRPLRQQPGPRAIRRQ